MMIENFKCDGCGKEDRHGKGWAQVNPYVCDSTSPPWVQLRTVGDGTKMREVRDAHLCSPKCAGRWLFPSSVVKEATR